MKTKLKYEDYLEEEWMNGLTIGHITQIISVKMGQKTHKSKKAYDRKKNKKVDVDE